MRFPLPTTNTTAQLIIPLGTINVVVTTAGAIQTITRSITMMLELLPGKLASRGLRLLKLIK